jgi:hypothetical protein
MPTNPIEYIWPGIIAAQAIYVATKLRIPDLLASGPKTVTELASNCGAHAATLERLLPHSPPSRCSRYARRSFL